MANVGRRFKLLRSEDVNDTSGTGVVATGIEWPDGHVAYRWKTDPRTTQFADCIDDVIKIHGHSGRTEVKWVD